MGNQESHSRGIDASANPSTPAAVDPDTVDNFALKGRHVVQIVDVHDGDTLTFILMLGDTPLKLSLRLLGIDTPEMNGETAQERKDAARARKRLIELLDWHPYKKGKATFAEVELVKWDKYGSRVDGNVWVKIGAGWVSCADVLLREKLARPYDGGKKPAYEHQNPAYLNSDPPQ